MKNYLFIVLALLVSGGCRNALLIEQSENSLENKSETLKIVNIDPRFFYEDESKNVNLRRTKAITDHIRKDVARFSRRNGIDLILYNPKDNPDPANYHSLLALKQNLLAANSIERTAMEFRTALTENQIKKKVFVYAPKVLPEFDALATTFGTPYFSYLGIYSADKELKLYHLVVNVESGETIYREKKLVRSRVNAGKIDQMIYDSFAMLKKELTKK